MTTESTFNFDKYDWKNGSLTGKGLTDLATDTIQWGSMKNPVTIYDRASGKKFNIIDALVVKGNNGLELQIDTSKEIVNNKVNNKMKECDKNIVKEWNDTHIPRGRVGHHATGIAPKYWVAVDDNSEILTNYSCFVNQSLQLTPLANNKSPTFSTIDPTKIKELAKRTIAKYPDKFVFVGKDDTSRGVMTQKNHLRSSVRYFWDPKLRMWNDAAMDESENSPLIKGTGFKGSDSSTANTLAQDTIATTVVTESIDIDKIATKRDLLNAIDKLTDKFEAIDLGEGKGEHNEIVELFDSLYEAIEKYSRLPEAESADDGAKKDATLDDNEALDAKIEEEVDKAL